MTGKSFFHVSEPYVHGADPIFAMYRPLGGVGKSEKLELDGVYFDIRNISYGKEAIKEIILESGLETYADYMINNIYREHSIKDSNIMGIINATPDSFFEGSRLTDSPEIVDDMVNQGCKYIDIGGESTRPGSKEISYGEEIKRLEPIMARISQCGDLYISLDTRHVETAEYFSSQINMVNDVSGNASPELAEFASEKSKDYVLMHTRGTPETMASQTNYTDLFGEITYFFWKNLMMLQDIGMPPGRIVLDPGIGFAKGRMQNYEIIKHHVQLNLGFRRMYGYSRKSFLGNSRGNPENKLVETLAITAYLAGSGIEFLRVHDPCENIRIIETLTHLVP